MILRMIPIILAIATASSPLYGANFISTNTFSVGSEELLAGENWVYSQTGIVAGVVEDDLFLLSNQLRLDGSFSNDVWAVATSADFNGSAGDRIRLAGQRIVVAGKAKGGLTALGETVKCDKNCDVSGEMLLLGNDVIFEGICRGPAQIIASRATLKGQIDGDLRLIAKDIVVAADCRIGGDLVYSAPKELFLPKSGIVDGELLRQKPARKRIEWKKESLSILLSQGLWFLGAVIVGIPLVSVFSVFTIMSVDLLKRETWRCLFTGFATLFLLPLFAFMIIGSVIGIPLALILAALYGILVYLSKYPVAMLLGILILRGRRPASFRGVLLIMVVGLAAIYLLTSLPYIGGTIQMVVTVYGLGALVGTLVSKRQRVIRIDPSRMPPPPPQESGEI